MPYIYNDEDNVPMNDEAYDRLDHNGHNPTAYTSYAEMKADEQPLPFTDQPEKGCWNCTEYNGTFCTLLWNNLDEAYKVTWRDEKEPDDWCPSWHEDKDAVWEDYHETDS
jgi:hypothetical protein